MNESKLIEGKCYFEVGYFDEKMSIPEILTHVYLGKNIQPGDNENKDTKFYFQDAESFFQHGQFTELMNSSLCNICTFTTEALSCLSDIHELVEEITRVADTGTGLITYS